jgi:hypothetical protein
VRREENRPFRAIAFEARNEVRFPRIRGLNDLNVEAEGFEARRKDFGDPTLVARRVARIGANEVAKQGNRRVGIGTLCNGGNRTRERCHAHRDTGETKHV